MQWCLARWYQRRWCTKVSLSQIAKLMATTSGSPGSCHEPCYQGGHSASLREWHPASRRCLLMVWTSYQIRKIAGCACAGNAGSVFPHHRGLAIPTCITARAWRTCRDACRDRQLAVSFKVGGGENVPGIPGACATRNFTHLARGPCTDRQRPVQRIIWASHWN